jgi:type IV secretion system protein VirD4
VRNPRDEPHWPDKAEQFIGAVVSYVLTMCEPQDTNMKSVCDILADRTLLDRVTRSLQNSPAWGGILSRLGHVLAHSGTEEKESVISTCNRMLRFMNSTAVEESLRTSSFDPRELTKGRMTLYLVIPAHHLRPAVGLLRLWLSTLHRVVIRGGVQR